MSYLKIYQKDFKVILGVAGILPVLCFIGGFYTGWSSKPRLSASETLSEAQAAVHDTSEAVRSEVDDLYANQKGDVSEEDLNQDAGLPEEYDGQRSESVEHMDAGNSPENSLADGLDAGNQLPENRQHGVAVDSSTNGKVGHKYTMLNISSLQSFNEYLVQAGRFSSYENAAIFQAQLTGKNLPSQIALDDSAVRPAFLIIVTSFTNKDEAKRYCRLAEEFYQLDFYVKARGIDLQKSSESFASL
jgi:hypothetical protein